jgi:hypothetical protein
MYIRTRITYYTPLSKIAHTIVGHDTVVKSRDHWLGRRARGTSDPLLPLVSISSSGGSSTTSQVTPGRRLPPFPRTPGWTSSLFRQVCVAFTVSRCWKADGGPATDAVNVDVDGVVCKVCRWYIPLAKVDVAVSGELTVPSSASSDADETVRCRLWEETRNRIANADLMGLFLSASWALVVGMRNAGGGFFRA